MDYKDPYLITGILNQLCFLVINYEGPYSWD